MTLHCHTVHTFFTHTHTHTHTELTLCQARPRSDYCNKPLPSTCFALLFASFSPLVGWHMKLGKIMPVQGTPVSHVCPFAMVGPAELLSCKNCVAALPSCFLTERTYMYLCTHKSLVCTLCRLSNELLSELLGELTFKIHFLEKLPVQLLNSLDSSQCFWCACFYTNYCVSPNLHVPVCECVLMGEHNCGKNLLNCTLIVSMLSKVVFGLVLATK